MPTNVLGCCLFSKFDLDLFKKFIGHRILFKFLTFREITLFLADSTLSKAFKKTNHKSTARIERKNSLGEMLFCC